jgi:hypothetical protein
LAEIDAMLLSQELGWSTMDGYSGNSPPGWPPANGCGLLPAEIMDYMDFAKINSPAYYLDMINRTVPIGFKDCDPNWWTLEPIVSSSSGPFSQEIYSGLVLKVVSLKSVDGLTSAQVEITNNSSLPIPAISLSGNTFGLSWRFIRAEDQKPWSSFDTRKYLDYDIPAHNKILVTIELAPPNQEGSYLLEVSAVQELIAWFYDRGTPIARSIQQLIVDRQGNVLVGTGSMP